jgi:hypothetical protein
MRLASRAALAAPAAGLTLALPALAHAATYCVNAPGCTGTNETTLQDALTAAQATTTETDNVLVGDPGAPGTGYVYNDGGNAANQVNIIGAGTSETVLTRTGSGPVFTLKAPGSTISHLTLELPTGDSDFAGVTSGSLDDVNVTTLDNSSLAQGAVNFEGSGAEHWNGGMVTLLNAAGNREGVLLSMTGGSLDIENLSISVSSQVFIGSPGTSTTLRHVAMAGAGGVDSAGDTWTLDEVTFHALSLPGIFIDTDPTSGQSSLVNANHVIAFGDNLNNGEALDVSSATSGLDATVNLRNSILFGFAVKAVRNASGGGSANINFSYDDTALNAGLLDSGGSGAITDGPGNINGDPLWTNAAAGNFTLGAGSPAIDKGDPAGLLPGDSPTDILGAPRISNGRQDMGAVEVQVPPPPPPVVKDTTPPTTTTSKLPKTLKFNRLLAGLSFTVTPSEPSAISATLAGAASTVKLAKNYNVTLASKSFKLAAGRRRITLKVKRKLLGKSRRFTLRLTLVATDAAGNKKTVTRTIKVKR